MNKLLLKYKFKIHYTDGSICWCLPSLIVDSAGVILIWHRKEDRSEIEP